MCMCMPPKTENSHQYSNSNARSVRKQNPRRTNRKKLNKMATIGLRSLVMLVGAGWTGSYMYNNINLERARNIATQVLLQHKKEGGESGGRAGGDANSSSGGSGRSAVEALTHQVDRLTREVSRSRSQDSVVIVGGGPGGYKGSLATVTDVFNLLGWAVFVLSAGGVIYFVMVRKRLSLRDLVWVSQSKFNDTVNAMQNGLNHVSGVVKSVRKDLGERLRLMEGKVEDVETNLSNQIETEVGEVKDGVSRLGDEVNVVSRGVDHVQTRIDEMNEKIEDTHRGVHLLLDFVTSLAPEKVRPGTPFYNLKRYMQNAEASPEQIEDNSMLRPRLSQGLAGLLPSTAASPSNSESSTTEANGERSQRDRRRSLDTASPSWPTG